MDISKFLTELFPGFREYCEHDDLLGEDYMNNPHALFDMFSGFYRLKYAEFSRSQLTEFFGEIENIISSDVKGNAELANAICTCFIELIAGTSEGEASMKYLGKASLDYYKLWLGN